MSKPTIIIQNLTINISGYNVNVGNSVKNALGETVDQLASAKPLHQLKDGGYRDGSCDCYCGAHLKDINAILAHEKYHGVKLLSDARD